jgi:hypothetical protein
LFYGGQAADVHVVHLHGSTSWEGLLATPTDCSTPLLTSSPNTGLVR